MWKRYIPCVGTEEKLLRFSYVLENRAERKTFEDKPIEIIVRDTPLRAAREAMKQAQAIAFKDKLEVAWLYRVDSWQDVASNLLN